jgi:uncharacterized coiled-coil protein SlyX
MDFAAAFNSSGSIGSLVDFNVVQNFRNTEPIKPLSYEDLCVKSLGFLDKVEKEPIVIDATAAVQRLKSLREQIKFTSEKITSLNTKLVDQVKYMADVNHSIHEMDEHFVSCGTDTNEFNILSEQLKSSMIEISKKTREKLTAEIAQLEQTMAAAQASMEPLLELVKVSIDAQLTTEEKEALKGGQTCSICYEHKVNRVYDGCGHTVCEGCLDRINQKQCHVCRANFNRALTLYLN